MISQKLPQNITAHATNSCVFHEDTLILCSSTQKIARIITATPAEQPKTTIINYQNSIERLKVFINHHDNQVIFRRRSFGRLHYYYEYQNEKLSQINQPTPKNLKTSEDKVSCKHSNVIVAKTVLDKVTLQLLPEEFADICKLTKPRQVTLYNYRSEIARTFDLDGIPVAVCMGKLIAAAVTKTSIFFFDLDI